MQHLKKPPIRRIIFLENFLHKDKDCFVRPFLLKYFPKCLRQLGCKFSDGHFNRRLKHVKIVKRLYFSTQKSNFWRLAVANKRKSIQAFFHSVSEGNEEKWTVETLRMFQNLKKVKLRISKEDEEDWTDQGRKEWETKFRWIRRACNFLNGTHGLRCLKIYADDERFLKILSKLNSSEKMLNRLKVFEMELSWFNNSDQTKILRFSKYKTVLKYLTHLSLDILAHQESFKSLQILPSYCPRLTSLRFSTSTRKFFQDYGSTPFFFGHVNWEKTNFLEGLKDFKDLQKLEITSYCGLKFLRKCQFPASLRHLSLKFYNFWCKEKDFPIQVGMEKLETLNVEFLIRWNTDPEDPHEEFVPEDETPEMLQEADHLKEHFIKSLLSRIVSPLKKLSLTLSRSHFADRSSRNIQRYQGEFDLTDFLRSIEHLRESLTTLHIRDRFLEYRLRIKEELLHCFPKLSEIFIETDISPFTDFEKLFNNGPCITKLCGIRINSCEALLSLFCKLGEIKGGCLKLHLYVRNLDNDVEYFERNWSHVMEKIGRRRRRRRRLKNVFLEITTPQSTFWEKKETKAFMDLFAGVDVVKIYADWFDKMHPFLLKANK